MLCPLALLAAAAIIAAPPAIRNPPLHASPGPQIEPIAVAKVKRVNGQIVLDGEWIPYGFEGRKAGGVLPVFDCFGRSPIPFLSQHIGTNSVYGPMSCVGPNGTTNDDGTRYFYTPPYTNANMIDDMQDVRCPPGTAISEVELAWYWNPPVASQLYVVIFPYEELLASTDPCSDPTTFTDTGGGGIAINYGVLAPSAPFFYYSWLTGLAGIGVLLPSTDDNGDPSGRPDGSYQLIFADSVTPSGIVFTTNEVQPMLWGTGDANGETWRAGRQHSRGYDDDNPLDGTFALDECYDYSIGTCPDPLGKCIAFSADAAACPFSSSPVTTQAYQVTGAGNGTNWSWTLFSATSNDFVACDTNVTGVIGTPAALATQFANSIKAYSTAQGCGAGLNAYTGVSGGIDMLYIEVGGVQAFNLVVGPANAPAATPCPPNIPCTFNPTLKLVPFPPRPPLQRAFPRRI